jgi:Thioredoxin
VVRLIIAAALVVVVSGCAAIVRRRQSTDAPSQPASWNVPAQIDRRDFHDPASAWVVVVFSSSSCQTCASVVAKASVLRSEQVAVQEVEFTSARSLHERYRIDAVPTTIVADGSGVVRASFLGPVTATDLWAAVAEARDPGSSPEPGLGQH